MMRHALEGLPLPVIISDSATSSTEARQTLRDNPDTRLALLDDGLQHLPLVRCGGVVVWQQSAVAAESPGGFKGAGWLRRVPAW